MDARQVRARLLDALLTFLAVVVAFAAFDDITTGNEPDFTTEYAAAFTCAMALAVVCVRLLRSGHHRLAAVSLLALGSAVWAQRAVGPGLRAELRPEYVVAAGAFLWFAALSFILFVLAFRSSRREPDGSAE